MFRQYKLRNYSFLLVAAVITISVIGIMVIGSAQQSSQIRQMAGLVIGVIAMLVLSLIDYTWILRFHWVMYIVGCFWRSSSSGRKSAARPDGSASASSFSRPI